ncbi:S8 family serine peptidase [Planomicrobium sp. YIM 101495]|uniref:S8 family peptidase n=1 Tax=Planomicrobium sp. YIM 101495 TaxID=2665160 RepID=UPI0018AB0B5E|nr:S8 family serine peptidase [Planomicrobium sp. YIM 101495]
MKQLAFFILLSIIVLLPAQVSAEGSESYLIYASEAEIGAIKAAYPSVTEEFEELPIVELALTDDEKNALQAEFRTAEIYPNREYTVTSDVVPSTYQSVKATPQHTAPYTGKGVRVAVLDTGIATDHPDLKLAGGVCTAAVCADGIPYDDNEGHGTHVAGIIAAQKNNKGIIGIAPGVELYAIKTMNNRGAGSTTQVAKGVEWAIQNDIDILNMSISIKIDDRPLEMMLKRAYDEGMIIVSAAGNEGWEVKPSTVTYPGKYSTVIAVGGLDGEWKREANSSYGPEVEISAPGQLVYSTYPTGLDIWDDKQDGYRRLTGTSMAAPHVSAIMAIYKEQYPGLANTKYREMIKQTALDIGKTGRDDETGQGIVQYEKNIKNFVFPKATVNKGHIQIDLHNKNNASGWTMTENGTALQETAPGKWDVYKTKGTYKFEVNYLDAAGKTVRDAVTLTVEEPAFPDLTMSSWFAPHISYLYSNNMIGGYTDGTFKPRQSITRAEAMIILGRAQGLDGTQRDTAFSDVGANNKASGYIQSAREQGLIAGFPDGTFKPYQSVTRAEMALLIHSTYRFNVDEEAPNPFTDVHSNMASYEAIRGLTQAGITQGTTAETFGPYDFMNRYTFSVFLARSENPMLIGK